MIEARLRDLDLGEVFNGLSLRFCQLTCEFERTLEVLQGKTFELDMIISLVTGGRTINPTFGARIHLLKVVY